MINKFFIQHTLCVLLIQLFMSVVTCAQDFSQLMSQADTVNFSVQKQSNWKLLSSYVALNATNDSVQFELIVFNDNQTIDWKNEQYLGKLKQGKFFSKFERVSTFFLLSEMYQLKIERDGDCYLSLKKGNPLFGSPTIIPIVIIYKL
jgi:uncharacterized membrane protein YkvI